MWLKELVGPLEEEKKRDHSDVVISMMYCIVPFDYVFRFTFFVFVENALLSIDIILRLFLLCRRIWSRLRL